MPEAPTLDVCPGGLATTDAQQEVAPRAPVQGMPAALEAVFPRTTLQTCIVHLIRDSLDYAGRKGRKMLAKALRPICAAASAEAAAAVLDAFADGEWGRKFPTVVAAWRLAWAQVIPTAA